LRLRQAGPGVRRGAAGTETAQVTITNTGSPVGASAAQLYLTDLAAAGEPPYQLKGFQKVAMRPGQSQRLTFSITHQDMSYYQTATGGWKIAPGAYRVSIGSSERDRSVRGWFYSG
jgi:beta-glucosidase